jgi:hypothetical protein
MQQKRFEFGPFKLFHLTPAIAGIKPKNPKRFGSDGDREVLRTINILEYHREDI